jgi:hypothetical protein
VAGWRTTDRIESALNRILAVGVFLLLVSALSAGGTAYAAAIGHRHAMAAGRTTTMPIRSEQSPEQAATVPGQGASGGSVVLGNGAAADSGVALVMDGRGLVPQPAGSGRALMAALSSAGAALTFGGAVLAGLWWAARWAINRWNLRRWVREWARFGPTWSRGFQ